MPYKINGRFEDFEKNYPTKTKKQSCIQDHLLHTKNQNLQAKKIVEHVCLSTKFVLRLKNEEILVVAIKKCLP